MGQLHAEQCGGGSAHPKSEQSIGGGIIENVAVIAHGHAGTAALCERRLLAAGKCSTLCPLAFENSPATLARALPLSLCHPPPAAAPRAQGLHSRDVRLPPGGAPPRDVDGRSGRLEREQPPVSAGARTGCGAAPRRGCVRRGGHAAAFATASGDTFTVALRIGPSVAAAAAAVAATDPPHAVSSSASPSPPRVQSPAPPSRRLRTTTRAASPSAASPPMPSLPAPLRPSPPTARRPSPAATSPTPRSVRPWRARSPRC